MERHGMSVSMSKVCQDSRVMSPSLACPKRLPLVLGVNYRVTRAAMSENWCSPQLFDPKIRPMHPRSLDSDIMGKVH